jgi:hypothetical protein
MGKKKNKAGIKPENQKEVTEKLQSPTGNQDPMKDPKVIAVLKKLEKLEKFNYSYQEGIRMTEHHLKQCYINTGIILPEDAEYCFQLAKRMAEHVSK